MFQVMIVNIAPPGQSAEKGCSVECGVTPAEAVVFAAWIAGPAYECTVLSARRGLAVLLSAEDCPLRATAATMRDIEVSLGGPLERWCASVRCIMYLRAVSEALLVVSYGS